MNKFFLSIQKLGLTPGEETILSYVIDKISVRLLNVLRLKVTYQALELAKDIEFEKLEEYQKEVQRYIDDNFPVTSKMQSYSALWSVFNDRNCWIYNRLRLIDTSGNPDGVQAVQEAEQWWTTSISYAQLQEDIGISKDVAKTCLERLINRELLEKKRGVAGVRFRIKDLSLLVNCLKENHHSWFAVECCHDEDRGKIEASQDHEKMLYVVKNKYDLQKNFEEHVSTIITKMETSKVSQKEIKIQLINSSNLNN